jgi:DNA invertase Pin-like site-specific DNA recombinase
VIAAYVRVSTRKQDLEAQILAISRAAEARGDAIDRWFQEKAGGHKLERAELTALREAARRGELEKVYVFRIDRLSRGGIRDTLAVVQEMRDHGCAIASIADGFSLEGPGGEIVLAVLAWAAQQEREALGDRIAAARERVERSGGRWGRPRRIDPKTLERARAMRAEGKSVRQIAVALKLKRTTLQDALAEKGHYLDPPENSEM